MMSYLANTLQRFFACCNRLFFATFDVVGILATLVELLRHTSFKRRLRRTRRRACLLNQFPSLHFPTKDIAYV